MTEALKLAGLKERALQEGDTAMPDPFVVLSLLSRLADSVSSNLKNSPTPTLFQERLAKSRCFTREIRSNSRCLAQTNRKFFIRIKKKKGRGLVAPESYAFL
jgi:hypothetical protein